MSLPHYEIPEPCKHGPIEKRPCEKCRLARENEAIQRADKALKRLEGSQP